MKAIPLQEAAALIPNGATLMIGGFMGVGTPEPLIDELVRQKKRDLTVIANDTASPGIGIGKLIRAELLRKAVVSHIGLNPETQQQMMAGALQVDLVPQGTPSSTIAPIPVVVASVEFSRQPGSARWLRTA